ncbi:MAG: PadR family transcriptional regulator [Anaerolineae bacterium]|nr:PadR family transcriptional regulator [Anaerolineae bacterium]
MSRLSPDEVILGLLAAKGTSYGYELMEHFRCQLGQVWHLSSSQLYAILKRLENTDLICGREVAGQAAPGRIEYWLTPQGERVFESWLSLPTPSPSTRRIRTEFLSRLYVARLLERPCAPLIQAQKRACQQYYSQLLTMEAQSDAPMDGLALQLRRAELGVILVWLDGLAAQPMASLLSYSPLED